jgi:ATP-dependent RNA helicase DHX57
LRTDFVSCLSDIGFIPFGIDSEDPRLNANKNNANLVKAVIVGGLWPRVAKVVLPKAMFDKIAAGSQQREHQAKEVKYFDQREGRVFLHPSSVLFSQTAYKSRFLVFFTKVHTSKVFIRDVTEVCKIRFHTNLRHNDEQQVPLYGLLLFGGDVRIKHTTGGVTIGSNWITLKSVPRIGVLINQLRYSHLPPYPQR